MIFSGQSVRRATFHSESTIPASTARPRMALCQRKRAYSRYRHLPSGDVLRGKRRSGEQVMRPGFMIPPPTSTEAVGVAAAAESGTTGELLGEGDAVLSVPIAGIGRHLPAIGGQADPGMRRQVPRDKLPGHRWGGRRRRTGGRGRGGRTQPRSVREGDRCSPSSSFLPPLGYEPYGMRLLRLCQSLCRGLTSGGSALKPPTGMSRTSSVRRSLATGWLMICQPSGAFSSHIPSTSTDQMSVGT